MITAFFKRNKGYLLVEVIVALIAVGTVTFFIINNDILPGLKAKWDIQNNAIQNNWIR